MTRDQCDKRGGPCRSSSSLPRERNRDSLGFEVRTGEWEFRLTHDVAKRHIREIKGRCHLRDGQIAKCIHFCPRNKKAAPEGAACSGNGAMLHPKKRLAAASAALAVRLATVVIHDQRKSTQHDCHAECKKAPTHARSPSIEITPMPNDSMNPRTRSASPRSFTHDHCRGRKDKASEAGSH